MKPGWIIGGSLLCAALGFALMQGACGSDDDGSSGGACPQLCQRLEQGTAVQEECAGGGLLARGYDVMSTPACQSDAPGVCQSCVSALGIKAADCTAVEQQCFGTSAPSGNFTNCSGVCQALGTFSEAQGECLGAGLAARGYAIETTTQCATVEDAAQCNSCIGAIAVKDADCATVANACVGGDTTGY